MPMLIFPLYFGSWLTSLIKLGISYIGWWNNLHSKKSRKQIFFFFKIYRMRLGQLLWTGSCNCKNCVIIKLSWEAATLAWKIMGVSHLERETFPVTFSPGEVWPLPEGLEDIFFTLMYFERVFEAVHNSFSFNFYMICLYFILKKTKRTLSKK